MTEEAAPVRSNYPGTVAEEEGLWVQSKLVFSLLTEGVGEVTMAKGPLCDFELCCFRLGCFRLCYCFRLLG